MCFECDRVVSGSGAALDALVASDINRRKREDRVEPDLTNAQHTIELAGIMLDSFDAHPYPRQALRDLVLEFSCAVTRLIAAQEIYGMPASS